MFEKLPTQLFTDALCGLLGSGAAVVAVLQSTINPDMSAVLGAIFATVIAVLEARKNDRSLAHTISVLLASGFLGSTLPGGLVWLCYPDKAAGLPWQVWAVCGFVVGLLGWAIVAGVLALRKSVTGAVKSEGARRLGLSDEDPRGGS